jgi:oxygen-independent coproporphyrinogen-3 oxidase
MNRTQNPVTPNPEPRRGLYLHIPFCQAICSYCNFNRGLLDDALKTRYVDALEAEIRRAPGGEADTIFFGGGTPSLLDPSEIARLIQACRDAFTLVPDAEITLETNPETATPARLAAFREAGINRLSFGDGRALRTWHVEPPLSEESRLFMRLRVVAQ